MVLAFAAVVVVTIGQDLVRLVYQRGAFTPADSVAVYGVLLVALGGFICESTSLVVTQSLFAFRRNDLSLRTGLTRVAIRIALMIPLATVWNARGVALAYSSSAALGLAMNVWFAYRIGAIRVDTLRDFRRFSVVAVGVLAICVPAGIAVAGQNIGVRVLALCLLGGLPVVAIVHSSISPMAMRRHARATEAALP
jgi:putative peptidoglycan lipid II flippase